MRDGAVVAEGNPDDVVTSDRLGDLYGVPIHVARVALPGEYGRGIRTWRRSCRRDDRADVFAGQCTFDQSWSELIDHLHQLFVPR